MLFPPTRLMNTRSMDQQSTQVRPHPRYVFSTKPTIHPQSPSLPPEPYRSQHMAPLTHFPHHLPPKRKKNEPHPFPNRVDAKHGNKQALQHGLAALSARHDRV